MGDLSHNPLKELIHEAHRRSLWQVLGVYLVTAWVVLQVVDVLVDNFGLPAWFPAFALGLLLVGLPVVLATAFVQEGGPEEGAPKPAGAAGEADGAASSSIFTWRNAIAGGVAAFALWGLVAAGWLVFRGPPGGAGPGGLLASDETRPTVAVLPFENLSASQENAYFADGMHEAILTNLARIGDLSVLSRTSVMKYEGTDQDLRTIARELGATAVVEGSVQRADGQVRVTAQLIDPRSDSHLWADSYDRTLDDVFAVQSEVARKVTQALEANLTASEQERIERRPTESLTAYDLYLKGREAYERDTRPANDTAVALYRRAVAADSSFALAWAGLANAYGLRVVNYGQSRTWADSAVAAGRRAVELDPGLDEAHKALALAHSARGRLRRSLEENRRAVELNPNHHGAINNIAFIHGVLGRWDEALQWYRRAFRLEPNDPLMPGSVARLYAQMGDTASAEEWLGRAREIAPDYGSNFLSEGYLDLARGRAQEALEAARRGLELRPETPSFRAAAASFALFAGEWEETIRHAEEALAMSTRRTFIFGKPVRSTLGFARMQLGRTAEGREALATAVEQLRGIVERGSEYPQIRWELGAAHAALGRPERALEWLERAHEAGYRSVLLSRHDPMLDDLRNRSRFQELMAEMESDVDRMRRRAPDDDRAAAAGGE